MTAVQIQQQALLHDDSTNHTRMNYVVSNPLPPSLLTTATETVSLPTMHRSRIRGQFDSNDTVSMIMMVSRQWLQAQCQCLPPCVPNLTKVQRRSTPMCQTMHRCMMLTFQAKPHMLKPHHGVVMPMKDKVDTLNTDGDQASEHAALCSIFILFYLFPHSYTQPKEGLPSLRTIYLFINQCMMSM